MHDSFEQILRDWLLAGEHRLHVAQDNCNMQGFTTGLKNQERGQRPTEMNKKPESKLMKRHFRTDSNVVKRL